MYDEIYIVEVALDIVGKDVFRMVVELFMAIWRTMVCVIHDKLADGVLCGNPPNFAGRVPSKNEIGFVIGDTGASDSVSPLLLIFLAQFYCLQRLMLLSCLFG